MQWNGEAMKKTVTIQIGNSDDKLTQREWSEYVEDVRKIVEGLRGVHFFGAAPTYAPWQNAAWVIECDDEVRVWLKENVTKIRKEYKQDSVAWTEGTTEFI